MMKFSFLWITAGLAVNPYILIAGNERSFQSLVQRWSNRCSVEMELVCEDLEKLTNQRSESYGWTLATVMLSSLAEGGQMLPLDLLDRFFRESPYPMTERYFKILSPTLIDQHAHTMFDSCIRLGDVYIMNRLMNRIVETKCIKQLISYVRKNPLFGQFNRVVLQSNFDDHETMQRIHLPSLFYSYVTKGRYFDAIRVLWDLPISLQRAAFLRLDYDQMSTLLEQCPDLPFELRYPLIHAIDLLKMIKDGNKRLARQLFRLFTLKSLIREISHRRPLINVSLEEAFKALSLADAVPNLSAIVTIHHWHGEYTDNNAAIMAAVNNSASPSTSTTTTTIIAPQTTPNMITTTEATTTAPTTTKLTSVQIASELAVESESDIEYDADEESTTEEKAEEKKEEEENHKRGKKRGRDDQVPKAKRSKHN